MVWMFPPPVDGQSKNKLTIATRTPGILPVQGARRACWWCRRPYIARGPRLNVHRLATRPSCAAGDFQAFSPSSRP